MSKNICDMDEEQIQTVETVVQNVLSTGKESILYEGDSFTRKLIHDYLDSKYKGLYHRGFLDESHPYDTSIVIFRECYNCEARRIYMKNVKYHYGFEKNNKDESYSGKCINCGESYCVECNYDDAWNKIKKNNAIRIGVRGSGCSGPQK